MGHEPTAGPPGQEGLAASENITATPPAAAPTPTPTPSESITAAPPAPAAVSAVPPPAAAPAPTAANTPLPAWFFKADLVILVLVLALTFLLGSFTASNSDIWLHLDVGQRISMGNFSFGADPYSWLTEATPDQPAVFWVHQSWLFSWLFFQLHHLVGGEGLVIIKALLFAIAILILSRIGYAASTRWFGLIALTIAALAVSPRLLLQPIVVSFLFLAITLLVIDRVGFFGYARPDGKKPDPRLLWVLPPLFALWANLDAWFILGPIVVGLCWAATGLMKWYPETKVVSGKMLGLVFGVGLLACVLNPYHVRVFQLPPELAYLVVSVSDALHLGLPNEFIGAGRTLTELRKAEGPDFSWTLSTASGKYWNDPRYGWSIAGMAIAPLFLLGLLGFVLTARIKPQPGAPTFHVGRFLLWLVFAVMALALYRMIPFFAIIAAPVTATTLGEFLAWQQSVSAVPAAKRDRGLGLARFISVPFLLLLLFLAWPGWLQDNREFNSPRRVAWDMRPDPSLLRAAQTLENLKVKGQDAGVFNGASYEVGHYIAYYSPGVKYGLDGRFALYADRLPDYLKARKGLATDNPLDWEDYFVTHHVEQVVVVNFVKNFPQQMHWWLDSDAWRQRDGDSRAVVFSWCGRGKHWPADADAAWNRKAFGRVPDDDKPPPAGAPLAQTPSQVTLYLEGVPPTPAGVSEFLLLGKRYGFDGFVRNTVGQGNFPASLVWMLASLTLLEGPGSGMTFDPSFVITAWPWTRSKNATRALVPVDMGPPALPILMVRATRRAVAENPLDPQSRFYLIEAVDTRNQLENYWAGNNMAGGLREAMRKVQLTANFYALTQLQPENWEVHRKFAEILERERMLDLALEHMKAAEKLLENQKPVQPGDQKRIDEMLRQQREMVRILDKAVRERMAKWKDITGNLQAGKATGAEIALQKAAVAYEGEFEEMRGEQRVRVPIALGKTALDLLTTVKPETLPEQARLSDLQLRLKLLLAMGRPNEVMDVLKLENVRKSVPANLYATNLLFAGAALGDYDAVDKSLGTLEKAARENLDKMNGLVRERAAKVAPTFLFMPKFGTTPAVAQSFAPYQELAGLHDLVSLQHNEFCTLITLRGIFALEAGNTDQARAAFERALGTLGTHYDATEAPIARRYLELLNEQRR